MSSSVSGASDFSTAAQPTNQGILPLTHKYVPVVNPIN